MTKIDKIVLISDTHGRHELLNVPECDLLICAGDYTNYGEMEEVIGFMTWFKNQPARHKVVINGNHEVAFHDNTGLFKGLIPKNVHYLENSGVEIEGIKIWGSPYVPNFYENVWRYMRKDEELKMFWNLIPKNIDILVTHCPPYGILDEVPDGYMKTKNAGSRSLREAVRKIKPKLHVAGHLHEARGYIYKEGTTFVNASSMRKYGITEKPFFLDWDSMRVYEIYD